MHFAEITRITNKDLTFVTFHVLHRRSYTCACSFRKQNIRLNPTAYRPPKGQFKILEILFLDMSTFLSNSKAISVNTSKCNIVYIYLKL